MKVGQNSKKRPLQLIKFPLIVVGKILTFIGKPPYYILLATVILCLTLYEALSRSLAKKRRVRVKIRAVKIRLPSLKIWHISGFSLLVIVSFCVWIISSELFADLPNPQNLINRRLEVSTKIYDRNGTLLYKIYKDKNRTPIPLDKIPQEVRLAALAAEDAEFYNHHGYSVKGITRSIIKFVKTRKLTSGSTITQQLVKNALLSSEKTLSRKARELLLAIQVERSFTKDQILEMYLNEVPYGGTAYGIEEASEVFFGKEVNELTLAEAAFLAGLPKSPTRLSPFGSHSELGFERQKETLNLMLEKGFISADQHSLSLEEEINFVVQQQEINAPHFVMYVKELLVEKYGEEAVATGGLEVYTTLDLSIQKLAEEAVLKELERLKSMNVTNAAAVVVHPSTGEILAMVGSKNYFDIKNDGNVNVTTRLRQPGSSIKVVNYAYALSHGFTAASILEDTPVSFSVQGQPPYAPKNYDNRFRGRLTLRSALAESRNIPAVKLLASYGVPQMVVLGREMGISSWEDSSRFGLSLTLGGGEVSLVDLARVYSTIANMGERPNITSISSIKDQKGHTIYKNTCLFPQKNSFEVGLVPTIYASESATQDCQKKIVLDPRVAFILVDILKDNNARAPAFGNQSALVIPEHPEVAVKTGTSNNLRDNLTVGFNKDYLTAVWVGNNDNTPMSQVASGVTGAGPIWNTIMTNLLKDTPVVEWQVPQGVEMVPICASSGTLPCSGCATKNEWFLEETKPRYACDKEKQLSQSH